MAGKGRLALVGLGALAALALGASHSAASRRASGMGGKGINPATGQPVASWSQPKLTRDELVALVTRHGIANVDKAVAIAIRESGGHPDAVADTRGMTPAQLLAYWGKPAKQEYSVGLWQINVLAFPQFDPELLKDPDYAADALYQISKGGVDWRPWGG